MKNNEQLHIITSKYAWKLKNYFLSCEQANELDEKLKEYFQLKKLELLRQIHNSFQDKENQSLLALLPEPWAMKDIRKAAQRIVYAMDQKEKITIFGDYDVDGTASCAMLKEFFSAMNYDVDVYIPDRLIEGYGLNPVGVKKLFSTGTKLIITVDNGISAGNACEEACHCGIDVIITDHHDVPSQLPKAFAILNPKQKDCNFSFKMLAGVGVAFYLMVAIRALLREKISIPARLFEVKGEGRDHDSSVVTERGGQMNLRHYLDFVAIGTIADMAPLNGVNHILCKIGLDVLHSNLKQGLRLGLYELLKLSGWNGEAKISSTDVGFKIGPRLNAAGRLGNALRSVDVLVTKDILSAKSLSKFLHGENTERQLLEKKFTLEALTMLKEKEPDNPAAFVLHKEDWHTGVVGLVASRVLEKYYKPTLVFGTFEGKLKGSGRSTHSFNLFAVLDAVREEFISFGGHFHAVGLTLDPQKLPWLVDYLQTKAKELIAPEDKIPPLFIDGKLPLAHMNSYFISRLETFEPYGIENPRLKWMSGPLQIKHIKRIGKDVTQGHAKILFLEKDKEFWLTGFGLADAFESLLSNGLDVELVIEAKQGYWNDREYVDLSIVDFAPVVYLNHS